MEFLVNALLNYWYVLTALALVVFVWRRDLRGKMLLGALLTLPALAVKPLISANYWAVFERNGGFLGFLMPRIAVAVSLAALLLAFYEAFLSKRVSQIFHPARKQLILLTAGIFVFVVLKFLLDFDFINSVFVALIVNIGIILIYERTLLWDLVFSSFGMGVIYILVYIQTSVGLPGDLHDLWIAENVIGISLLSAPIEEIAAVFLFGSLWGPLYVSLKEVLIKSVPQDIFAIKHLKIKRIISTAMLLGFWIGLIFISNNLLLIPKVTGASLEAVDIAQVRFNFNMPIFRPGLEVQVYPPLTGNLYFQNSILNNHLYKSAVFVPDQGFIPGQSYTVTINGIANVFGLGNQTYSYNFTARTPEDYSGNLRESQVSLSLTDEQTENTATSISVSTPEPALQRDESINTASIFTVLLDVPIHYQDKPLSCEVAALKMALNYKGLPVTEDQLMAIVGFDPTIKQSNIWGDPDVAFVGDINGKQNSTGYGVHWTPIARAANTFRRAESFSGWTVQDLTQAVLQDRPVIIWGVIGNSYPEVWYTSAGREIRAWKGEHTFVVVGFNGSAENPESFILNDPITGRVVWSTAKLQSNWATFNNSGVVIY